MLEVAPNSQPHTGKKYWYKHNRIFKNSTRYLSIEADFETEGEDFKPLTASELNTLDGITASTANLNQLTNKEVETSSVMDETAGLPDHLANALNKDYSGVMKKVEEKAKFNKGPGNGI